MTNTDTEARMFLSMTWAMMYDNILMANSKGCPRDLEMLRMALKFESSSARPRVTVCNLIRREIRRQEKGVA